MTTSTDERLDLTAEPGSVRQARAFVRDVFERWGLTGQGETAALLVSELATNVVLHARTPYAVVVSRTGSGAQVDVLDRSRAAPQVRKGDLGARTGRGLAIVASLASDWGATPGRDLGAYAKGVRFTVG